MIVRNFKLVHVSGTGFDNFVYYALVDVTTGLWFWKKTETKEVSKSFAGNWYFTDTGEFILSSDLNKLERAYCAKNLAEYLHQIKGD